MANSFSFFDSIGTASAPTRGGEAETLAAADAQAKANTIDRDMQRDVTGFLGTMGMEAAKGYKEASFQKEVQQVLNNTETPDWQGRDVIARKVVRNNLAASVPMADSDSPEFAEYVNKVNLITVGRDQGVYNRQQAIDKISDLVKTYSAQLPGLASDFRKIAAEQSGISNIDSYGVHKALTEAGAREKAALHAQQKEIDFVAKVADHHGKMPNQVTQADLQEYQLFHHYKNTAAIEAAKLEINKANVTTADADHAKLADARNVTGLNDISNQVSKVLQSMSASDLNGSNLASQGYLEAVNLLTSAKTKIQQYITSGYQTYEGRQMAPWSYESRNKWADDRNKYIDSLLEGLKTADGRKMILATSQNAQAGVSGLILNQEYLNPALAFYDKHKLMPVMYQLAVTSKMDANVLATQLGGPHMLPQAKQMVEAMKNPGIYNNVMSQLMSGAKADANQPGNIAATNPNETAVALQDIRTSTMKLMDLAEKPNPTPNELQAFANGMAAWGKNFNIRDPNNVRDYEKFINNPNRAAMFNKLTPEQKRTAIAPFMEAQTQGVVRAVAEIKTTLSDVNKEIQDSLQTMKYEIYGGEKLAEDALKSKGGLVTPKVELVQGDALANGALQVKITYGNGSVEDKLKYQSYLLGIPKKVVELERLVKEMNTYAMGAAGNAHVVQPTLNYTERQAYSDAYKMVTGQTTKRFFYPTQAIPESTTSTSTERRSVPRNESVVASYSTDSIVAELKQLAALDQSQPSPSTDERVAQLTKILDQRGIKFRIGASVATYDDSTRPPATIPTGTTR